MPRMYIGVRDAFQTLAQPFTLAHLHDGLTTAWTREGDQVTVRHSPSGYANSIKWPMMYTDPRQVGTFNAGRKAVTGSGAAYDDRPTGDDLFVTDPRLSPAAEQPTAGWQDWDHNKIFV